MKLSGWLLRISLIVMIAVSLVFTWFIWENPSRLGNTRQQVTVQSKTDPNAAKLRGQVFAPTTAYYTTGTDKRLLFKNDTDVPLKLRAAMRSWHLGTVKAAGKLSASAFAKAITQDGAVQLVYTSPVTYSLFNQNFFKQKAAATQTDFKFNRLIVGLGHEQPTVTFVNDQTRQLWRAKVTKGDSTAAANEVKAVWAGSFKAGERRVGKREVTDFTSPIAVAPYAYLLDQQNANHYVSLLMPSQETSSVDTREIGTETVYTVGTDYRLTMATDTGVMQFENATAKNRSTAQTTVTNNAYQALGSLSLLGLNYMRYYSYDSSAQEAVFRSYAQGLPIFNDNYSGRVAVASTASGLQIVFSSNNLTVPIPTKQAKVTLPATETVTKELRNAGFTDASIQNITLGYEWVQGSSDDQVVTLKPTYFVEINRQYRPYQDWLKPQTDKTQAAKGARDVR